MYYLPLALIVAYTIYIILSKHKSKDNTLSKSEYDRYLSESISLQPYNELLNVTVQQGINLIEQDNWELKTRNSKL